MLRLRRNLGEGQGVIDIVGGLCHCGLLLVVLRVGQ